MKRGEWDRGRTTGKGLRRNEIRYKGWERRGRRREAGNLGGKWEDSLYDKV